MDKKDLSIRWTKGPGKGGQRKNKVETACEITHIPTGITAWGNERTRPQSKRSALKSLEEKINSYNTAIKNKNKKENRDYKIHNTETIRTYDYKQGIVKDHRSGKTASIKNIMDKGKIDLLK